jgi:hypothetical protein
VPEDSPLLHFDLYRYQLLPITRNVQVDLFRGIESTDSLRAKKNQFFAEVVAGLKELSHRHIEILHRLEWNKGDWFVLHIGAKKSLERSRKDFRREKLEDWPNVYVVISNAPDVQGIAITRNPKAFTSTAVVAKMLLENLQPALKTYQLHLEVEAVFEQQKFWTLVSEYRGRIKAVKFELVSPNMANISKSLELDLHQINADTNSHRTDLKLNAGQDSSLEIKKQKTLESLVDYASAGGGDIVLTIRGMKRNVRTSKSVREVVVDELILKNPNKDTLEHLFTLLK